MSGAVRSEPGVVVGARVLMGVVAAVHLTVLVVTLHDGPPSLSGVVFVRTVVVHGVLFPATTLLAWTLGTGHRLVLRPATATQICGVAFCALSTPSLASLWWVVPAECLLAVGILGLLWGPRRSQHFFARTVAGPDRPHPGSRRP